MAITDGLITLEEAKYSLNFTTTNTALDSELEKYIEAATPVIEDITGPVLVKTRSFTFDGGCESVALPVRFTSVTSVLVDGSAVAYVADPGAGIIYAGKTTAPDVFEWGIQNVAVTVSVGYATNATEVEYNVRMATRELVRHAWQRTQQANTPAFGEAPDSTIVPMGFLVSNAVMKWLEPNPRLPGFA